MLPFDAALEQSIAAARTPGLTSFFSFITNFGDVWFAVFAAGIIWALLSIQRRGRYTLELFLAVAGSGITVLILKHLFAEPRPLSPVALMTIDSFSFPSGHAAAAASLYGFLLWMSIGTGTITRARAVLAAACAALIVLIGFSRLYLGVHYFSDVIAGYLIGFAWVALGVQIARSRVLNRFSFLH